MPPDSARKLVATRDFSPKRWILDRTLGPFRFSPIWIFGTTFHLKVVRSFRSVGSKHPFPFDKIVVPSTALLYPTCKNNNQTCGGLGRAGETGLCRSIGRMELPKFQTRIFDEWKAPNTLRSWIVMQCCLLVHRNLTHLFLIQSLKFGTQHAVRTTSRWSGRAGA